MCVSRLHPFLHCATASGLDPNCDTFATQSSHFHFRSIVIATVLYDSNSVVDISQIQKRLQLNNSTSGISIRDNADAEVCSKFDCGSSVFLAPSLGQFTAFRSGKPHCSLSHFATIFLLSYTWWYYRTFTRLKIEYYSGCSSHWPCSLHWPF